MQTAMTDRCMLLNNVMRHAPSLFTASPVVSHLQADWTGVLARVMNSPSRHQLLWSVLHACMQTGALKPKPATYEASYHTAWWIFMSLKFLWFKVRHPCCDGWRCLQHQTLHGTVRQLSHLLPGEVKCVTDTSLCCETSLHSVSV